MKGKDSPDGSSQQTMYTRKIIALTLLLTGVSATIFQGAHGYPSQAINFPARPIIAAGINNSTIRVMLSVDGTITSHEVKPGITVADFLYLTSVTLGKNDEVNLELQEPVSNLTLVKVSRMTRLVTLREKTVPFTKIAQEVAVKCDDKTSKNTLITAGVDGKSLETVLSVTSEGEVLPLSVLNETVTVPPVTEVSAPCQVVAPVVKTVVKPVVTKTSTTAKITPVTPVTPVTKVTGSKVDWMRAAGIPESDWQYVDFIVTKESGWNPNAVNKSSGACSLAQALPCSKLGPNWRDPVVALKWQYKYVEQRYNGYAGAYAFWRTHNWY